MSRYIDAELLLEDNTHEWFDDWGNYTGAGLAVVNAPTADVVEVVHARWEDGRYNSYSGEYEECCSRCELWSVEFDKPYCPNCGAKTDGKKVK